MDWSTEDIIRLFNGVVRDSKNMNSKDLESKYSLFKEKLEPLYNMAINSVANGNVQETLGILNMMLKARTDMQTGKMSKLTTDMLVGNQLGKKYIYPITDTPSKEDYKRAIDKITSKVEEESTNTKNLQDQ